MMNTQRTLLRPLLLMTAGSAVLLTLSLFPSRSQSFSKEDTPPKVTEMLDCIIQPRFQKDAGVFGTGRIITLPGHRQQPPPFQRRGGGHRPLWQLFWHPDRCGRGLFRQKL